MTDKIFMFKLFELSNRLAHTQGTGQNLLEMYTLLVDKSELKENCTYAHKAYTIFMKNDFDKVKELIGELYTLLYK